MSVDRLPMRYLGLVVLSVLLLSCSQNNAPEVDQVTNSKEETMQLSHEKRVPNQIPPIDAAVPKEYHTASFGLG